VTAGRPTFADVDVRAKIIGLHDAADAECDRLSLEWGDAIERGPHAKRVNERDYEQAWGRRAAFREVLDLLNEADR
jgi:hypothetical protein